MYDDEIMTEDHSPKRHFAIEQIVFILLIILSLAGIYITSFNPDDGYGYWLLMVFVFGLLSLFVAWLQSKNTDANFTEVLKAQGMHWLHTIIVVIAASFLNKSGQLTGVTADVVILLVLGLSAMLDGYHVGWEFSLLGFFLVGCAIIIGYIPAFIWASVVLAIIIIIASFMRGLWFRSVDE